jgi:crossover junction endodeoxyribonuclease RuvC
MSSASCRRLQAGSLRSPEARLCHNTASKAAGFGFVDSMLNTPKSILTLGCMRVLAVDASLRNTGVAIVDANNGKPRPLYFGTIHNKSAMRPSSCLVCIRDRLVELIREHEPDCCALESVIYVQSYKTAIILGAARGAAILAAAENGLPIFEYPPRRIKQSTVGRGAAGKNQVAFMVRALLGLTETPSPDAADALAIGLTHLRMQEAAALGIGGAVQI